MVRSGNGHDLCGVRHWACLPRAARIPCVVAVVDTHAAAVWPRRPEVLVENAVTVHIVPARIEKPSIRQQGGRPLMRFVKRDRTRILTIRSHSREREHKAGTKAAPMVTAASRGGEHDVAVRQVDGKNVVVAVVRQSPRRAACKRRFINVVAVREAIRRAEAGNITSARIRAGGSDATGE